MAIDPTIATGFRSPMATVAAQPSDPLEMVSRMVSLKALMNRMQGGQSLGSMMATTGGGSYSEPQGSASVASVPPTSTPVLPTAPPGAAASSLMMGVSRYGQNVHSVDGGKTWLNSNTGLPADGDVYQQTVVLGGQ